MYKMLQFGFLSPRIIGQKLITSSVYRYSSVPTIIFKNNSDKTENDLSTKSIESDVKTVISPISTKVQLVDKSSTLVAAAFASLKSESVIPSTRSNTKTKRKNVTDDVIDNATTIDALLTIAEAPIVSRKHSLKVVSILADWSASGKVKLSDFETDVRFQKLCRILGRTGSINNKTTKAQNRSVNSVGDDLSTVLGVTGDDEAAKLVASISLSQMVKVLSALAQKRRRSTPLLRSLANNITNSNETLDLKQCADVLYAAAVLTFPEISLLERACTDLMTKLPLNEDKSAVVGSILTSIGLLRYKNTVVLDTISEWIVKYQDICRPQDIFSLFLTLAMVSYHPINSEKLYNVLLPQLSVADTPKSSIWLDFIWSLTVLNIATETHIATALNPEFITRLKDENSLTIASKIKLLNIQGYATSVLQDYSGPKIPEDSDIPTITIIRSREKQALVAAMLDSLGSLLPSVTYLRSNLDTGMGFFLDGECLLDEKCNPLPVSEQSDSSNGIKIAFMAYDYHDLCRGNRYELNGMNSLAKRLLEKKGYNVIGVPHTEFNPRDKLIRRVQYLESFLKDIVKQRSSNI